MPWRAREAVAYAALLVTSFERLTGRALLEGDLPPFDLAERLFHHPQPLVSHGTEADPVFCYGNDAALSLWQMGWHDFTRLPSRQSAQPDPDIQSDRAALLARALQTGWVADYSGIRISAKGQRFRISDTILWTVTDAQGARHGQAALIGSAVML
jgi:hypothetical protein